MPRILLDENSPVGLRRLLPAHEVEHVARLGWDGIANGALVAAAEQEGFAVLITADRNLRYQQNLAGRRIALLILDTNNWRRIQASAESIRAALREALAGRVIIELELRRPDRASRGEADEP